MKRLANREAKISEIESRLSTLRMTASYGTQCTAIAKLELQLSMLYSQSGDKQKGEELLEQANKTLSDPLCIASKEKRAMQRYIENYKANPGLANIGNMPTIYKYLSMIVLLGGYVILYFASTIYPITSNEYLVGILAIFVLSMLINFFVRSRYVSRANARQ